MSTNTNIWKSIAVSAIIIAIVLGGILAYAEVTVSNLNNDKNNLQSNYNALKTQADQDTASITLLQSALAANKTLILQLQKAVSADEAQINYLTIQLTGNVTLVSQLQAQIVDLNSQISKLQQQISYVQGEYQLALEKIASLEKSNVGAIFTSTWVQPVPPICFIFCFGGSPGMATVTGAAWANFGTIPANNAQMIVTFFDSSNNALCTTPPIPLGNMGYIPGDTINGNSNLNTSCTTPDTANQFDHATITSLTWS